MTAKIGIIGHGGQGRNLALAMKQMELLQPEVIQTSKTHELKVVEPFFEHLRNRSKNFELRRNDRDFQVGDFLILKEYSPEKGFSGRALYSKIRYILKDCPEFGLMDGYCILGLED
jgi:hypothetical protein